MSEAVARQSIPRTPDQYLEEERQASFKSEYAHGEVFAMSGGAVAHNLVATNLTAEIHQQLKGRPCLAFNSDMKVWVGEAETFAYPDVSALCGDVTYLDEKKDVITNPSFIAEVLSPSTEAYDLGGKFRSYARLASFQEYLLLSQFEYHVELRQRNADGSWHLHFFTSPEDRIPLKSIGCELVLGDLYDKVAFEPMPEG